MMQFKLQHYSDKTKNPHVNPATTEFKYKLTVTGIILFIATVLWLLTEINNTNNTNYIDSMQIDSRTERLA